MIRPPEFDTHHEREVPRRRKMRGTIVLGSLLAVALAACAKERTDPPRADTLEPPAASMPGQPPRPGIRFDPATLQPGAAIGTLIADSVAARPTVVDSTLVGIARFRGEIEVSGSTFRHPDADIRETTVCFETDSTSAARLPRWAGDERRPWFCFINQPEAKRSLGPPGAERPATIVIDRFTIHRGFSDEVNSVRLVRVVSGGGSP